MFWTALSLPIFQFKSFGDLDFWLSWRISPTLETRSMGITENFQVNVFTIFTINISSLGIFPRLPMGCRKHWLFKYTGITIILKHSESSKRIFPSWKRGQWVAGINKPWVEWQQTLRQNKLNGNFQRILHDTVGAPHFVFSGWQEMWYAAQTDINYTVACTLFQFKKNNCSVQKINQM